MAERYKCEYCEMDFAKPSALKSHIKYKHPEKVVPRAEEKGVPDAVGDFELLLNDYGIKKAAIIAKNIATTGSQNVFDNPEELAKKLAKWPRDIAPVYRATILDHWLKSRGVAIPSELIEEVSMEEGEKKAKAKKKEAEKKQAEGAVWTVDVDESGTPKIRMIKDETEPGVTLAEAKTAAKEIGKEREESIVVYNEASGRHMPNFKSPFVKQNLSAAWATARQMDKAMAEGEPIDPMDIWLDQQAKVAQLKELMGFTPETKEKGTVAELVTALKDLQEMVTQAKPSDSGVAESLKTELASLSKSLEEMKEQRYRDQLSAQQQRVDILTQKVTELTEAINDPTRRPGVKTELDILYEIAHEGIGLVKTELPSLRSDIRAGLGGLNLPPSKTPQQREERKQRLKTALQADKEIEGLVHRLFLGEE